MMKKGKVKYDSITDKEALEAFVWWNQAEGIVSAFESAHAIAYLKKIPKEKLECKTVIVSLSGRGDKTIGTRECRYRRLNKSFKKRVLLY